MNKYIKVTEYNLKNVNEYMESVNYFKRELLIYSRQEEKFKNEINSLNKEINKYTDLLKKIKLSIEVLSPINKKIIDYFYFKNLTGNDIAAQLKLSIATIFARKTNAIKEISQLMYSHFNINTEELKIKPYKKPTRPRPVYQYDLDEIFVKKWSSAKEFCDQYDNYNPMDLRNACIGGIKTFKGYIWRYEPIQKKV